MDATIHKIAELNKIQLKEIVPLYSGSINSVYLLKCNSIEYVLKINDALKFSKMFETEAKGLQVLKESQSFKIPTVIRQDEIENSSYLLMEYIPSGKKSYNFNEIFAENLVKLHQCTQDFFGLQHHNYIGSLPQFNHKEFSASDFYINQRLAPQIKLAGQNGFTFKNSEAVLKNISEIIPEEPSSLLHGDLWNGNYIISHNDEACLIDPAISYGSREMDISMMLLFGGFSDEIYTMYHEKFPFANNWKERVSLWQLYYLLVHLNLFGVGYFSQVNTIIKQYS
ncbi:MAG: fructosamine-3-kinase [Flavobacteriaceae bacterium]|jgi:fructosamine-3-kinase|uniref:fructosamine kinase family protein n=1 Tax=Candidatus Marifrigoribacter sp. Uisw_064 TaxID=3230970 RepID=UPI003AEEC313